MKQAREQGLAVGFVSVTERKRVVDWLEGKGGIDEGRILRSEWSMASVASCADVGSGSTGEGGTPPGSPGKAPASLPASSHKTRATAQESSTSAKRRYVPDANDVEVVKRIKQGEIELQDRNTVLRGTKPNVSSL